MMKGGEISTLIKAVLCSWGCGMAVEGNQHLRKNVKKA